MKRLVQLRIFAVMAVVAMVITIGAHAGADTIVQSFKASSSIPPGWLVSLAHNSSTTVVLTPANQSQNILGVTIDPSQAPLTLQRQTDQQVFVATDGVYPLLVSTQNGAIHSGDYLSISSTSGIAAKATTTQARVVGQATQKFDGTSGVLSSGGGSSVGKINVIIQPEANPLLQNTLVVPSIIRKAGNAVAGKDISPVRLYVGLVVMLAAIIMAAGILIAGIRSSMISIGRNPLSRSSILRALFEVVVTALVVLALGFVGVYLLLKI